jgi:hypothetical protein
MTDPANYEGHYVKASPKSGQGAPRVVLGECVAKADGELAVNGFNVIPATIRPTIDLEKKQPIKDPKGGLTAAGRRHFKEKEGANLKPGVKGAADTPEKMRRKGSFLTRFFTNPSGPMVNDKGEPTRLALSAAAWGEPVPKNRSDAAKLAAKGRRLLERYENTKEK